MRLAKLFVITNLIPSWQAFAAPPPCGWDVVRWSGEVSYEARAGGLLSTVGNGKDPCEGLQAPTIKPLQASVIKYRMDTLSLEIAAGKGESIDALAKLYQIPPQQTSHLGELLKQNYKTIFPTAETRLQDMYSAIDQLVKSHPTLGKTP